jgi:hypothetical protein
LLRTSRLLSSGLPALAFAAILGVSAIAIPPASAAQAPNCPVNGLTLLDGQSLQVVGDCIVTGDITLTGSSLLIVSDSKFVVRGNIKGHDRAFFYVQRSEFTVGNRFNSEFSISMFGDSVVWLQDVVFRSNEGTGNNYFMAYFAHERSRLRAVNTTLEITNSWIIGRFRNQSQLFTSGAHNFPSEVVVLDQSTVRLESDSRTSLWIPFPAGSGGTVFLPDQTLGPYSFSIGRSTPGMVGLGYDVRVLNSSVRLVINSLPGSAVAVVGRGRGIPGYGEVSIALTIIASQTPQVISGLRPGFQAYTRITSGGRNLILYNVELDPIGWHVYVSGGSGLVTLRNSVLNEVAAFPGGQVQVEGSVLQWAVLGSTGVGSSLVVRDSQVFAQLIRGEGDGRLELYDSVVHGAAIEALDQSSILVSGGLFVANGETTPCDHLTGLTPSAIPRCNPFLAPGVLPVTHTMDDGEIVIEGQPPSAVADLHVAGQTDPPSVAVGQQFTYRAQTGNAGPDDATGVKLRFRTPTQAAAMSFPSNCSLVGRDVECSVGDLPLFTPSQWISVHYRALAALTPAIGEVTVTADQVDPDPTNHYVPLSNAVTP